ncbi:riboflavin transporter [Variibacter gotjawalensis]|uniref:Riboflavin transporter n=1 Tax=Variibacter gotjawalensis TaxID=1333996 RepID=A0A0S3PP34_9BRAD|nr:DMT family transporter [Variibacter gotjawalensis]NIK47985.1 drug/metabolite transporter (DMT)-like permease [Variibacter gotjawalensis]RZS49862.1 drug/metabolite transporter (DMT)-like permease [Variibacter gotjawalensis]BAT57691.1 riboflavin transporter [Variibacter gotjawalensis]
MSTTLPSDPDLQRKQRLKGILLMMGAVFFFACLDSTAKYLNNYMDTAQVVWARYTAAFLLAFLFVNPFTYPGLTRTSRLPLQIGRSILLLASTVLNVIALRYLRLDQTASILFSTPFIIALLSGPLLGEKMSRKRWGAIIVGFLGVLVVVRPGIGGMHPAALLCVLGAMCYATYSIATRLLSRTDSSETTLFYSNIVGIVALSFILPFVWTPPQSWFIAMLMVFIGAAGAFGHYLLILAHRLAPAAVLAPFGYTQIVWMIASGFIFFDQLPDRYTLIGASIVIGSGLYLLFAERRR